MSNTNFGDITFNSESFIKIISELHFKMGKTKKKFKIINKQQMCFSGILKSYIVKYVCFIFYYGNG